jgi:co-chaperonin GroES (HSP10)
MYVPYSPTWKEHEEKLHSDNYKEATKAAEAFDLTRKQETRASKKARDWESDRKKAIAKDKPAWVKEQQSKEQEETNKIVQNIKNFGTFDYNLRPYKGFILIKIIEQDTQQLPSGLFLPDSDKEDNVAEVIEVGGPVNLSSKVIVEAGVSPKDRVLLKKFAGIDVETKQGKCKLVQFSDILGVLE